MPSFLEALTFHDQLRTESKFPNSNKGPIFYLL